jgi:hypothetical protein
MLRFPKHEMIALDIRQVLGWRPSLGGYAPDRGPGAIFNVLIRAFGTTVAIVFLLFLFLL